jgi:hypothetical protein
VPICLVFAVFLVSQGMIQNFKALRHGETIKPAVKPATAGHTTIVQGPMASQVAIKMLGTNGGGYTNANAAHPFENPTPLSNFSRCSRSSRSAAADLLPRAHDQEPRPRLGRVERDDDPVPRRRALLLVGRSHGNPDPSNALGVAVRTATWRARKSASASSTPRSSPPSPPTRRAAR